VGRVALVVRCGRHSWAMRACLAACARSRQTYMEEAKVKVSATHLTQLEWVPEGRKLLEDIRQMQVQ
jgi:hypothetical protein